MLDSKGHVKLIDFGTSKRTSKIHIERARTSLKHTLNARVHVARSCGLAERGRRGDLWSIGVVAHVFLTGLSPFRAQSPYFSFLKIRRATLQIGSRLVCDCLLLSVSWMRCCKKEPTDRLGAGSRGDLSLLRNTDF